MNVGSALPGYSPVYAHVAFLVLRVPFRGSPVPISLSRSHGTHDLLWQTSPCPGCPLPSTHLSTSRSQPVNGLLHPSKRFRAFFQHQQQSDLLLVNLTNPLTNITLTPGSLGWDSLLPPIIHSHHAFHIHSIHSLGPADPFTHCTFLIKKKNPLTLLATSPRTSSCPSSSLPLMHFPFNSITKATSPLHFPCRSVSHHPFLNLT